MTTVSQVARLFYEAHDNPKDDPPELRIVSVRMAVSLMKFIDAMASEAGVSRNTMAVKLLEVGIGEVMAELPDSIREGIESIGLEPQGGQA
jgi:hypothetical protein